MYFMVLSRVARSVKRNVNPNLIAVDLREGLSEKWARERLGTIKDVMRQACVSVVSVVTVHRVNSSSYCTKFGTTGLAVK